MPPFVPFLLLGCAGLGLAAYALVQLLRVARTGPSGPVRAVAGVFSLVGVAGIGTLGLGVAGFAGVAVVGTALVENGPVRHVQVLRAGDTFEGAALVHPIVRQAQQSLDSRGRSRTQAADDRWPVQVVLDWQGEPSVKRVERWLDRHCDSDIELLSSDPIERDGQRMTRLHFGIELSRHELRELEELESWIDLPRGLSIEVR